MAKSVHLQEVEDAAVRITNQRIKSFKEEQAIKMAKLEADAMNAKADEAVEKKASK